MTLKANPKTHRCSSTLDYSDVAGGKIVCVECGRKWILMINTGKDGREWPK